MTEQERIAVIKRRLDYLREAYPGIHENWERIYGSHERAFPYLYKDRR